MRIAFVGKGGSGKTTVAALFASFCIAQGKIILTVDADMNIHLGGLLGAPTEHGRGLSYGANPESIRTYLRGSNTHIPNISQFVKSTPPGQGSALVTLDSDNLFIKDFCVPYANTGYHAYVGTYQDTDIGTACYHANLSVFENVLSHLVLRSNECLITDMVAGVDEKEKHSRTLFWLHHLSLKISNNMPSRNTEIQCYTSQYSGMFINDSRDKYGFVLRMETLYTK